MKRRILGYVAVMVTVICLCAAPSFAADNAKIGVGYQGMFAGNLLNGLSVRGWVGPNTAIGVEGNLFYGGLTIKDFSGGEDLDASLLMLEIKAMYAFIVRTNSRFYAGGKFAYGQYKLDPIDFDGKVYIPGIFVGAEWNFPSLPELGFNFDVGYNYVMDRNDAGGDDVDLNLHGINVGMGVKYYF
jgi:hypothetical protein